MQRLLHVLAAVGLVLAAAAVFLWISSYVTGVHVGRVTIDVDLYGVKYETRGGCFVQQGRFVCGVGTRQHWPAERLRPPSGREHRRGVFAGDFGPWVRGHEFLLGFGLIYRDADSPLTGLVGDRLIISTPIAWWLLLFLTPPLWHRAGRRLGMTPRAVLGTVSVCGGLLAGFAAVAVPLPGLGGLILLYVAIVTTWAMGRYGIRSWQELRLHARRGRCRVCGYDLRATPDPEGALLDRCPECGTFTKPLRRR